MGNNMHIVLTGATGLVGRHVLYELLYQYINGIYDGQIHLIVRQKGGVSGPDRVRHLLTHPYRPQYLNEYTIEEMLSFIQIIESDVSSLDLENAIEDKLSPTNIYYVIHMAASTNLFSDPMAEQNVYTNNYMATRNLIKALSGREFKLTFVSTSFSCGQRAGLTQNEYLGTSKSAFRNPYEFYKNRTEEELNDYCLSNYIPFQILRPSVICGRLYDEPFYYTSKFDVFYGWTKFFWKIRGRTEERIRIHIKKNSGLNIVPVDYVSKVIVRLFYENTRELNIVQENPIPHENYISLLLSGLNFNNYEFVEKLPIDVNRLEKLYYKSAGDAFGPYITAPRQTFDTKLLWEFVKPKEPDLLIHLGQLIQFAVENEFEAP